MVAGKTIAPGGSMVAGSIMVPAGMAIAIGGSRLAGAVPAWNGSRVMVGTRVEQWTTHLPWSSSSEEAHDGDGATDDADEAHEEA